MDTEIPKSDWTHYFNRVSRGLIGKRAEVEIASLNLGVQVEAKHLPVNGIVYDHKDDAIGVLLEGVDHLIRHPTAVYVNHEGLDVRNIAVVAQDGTRHLINLSRPLALPAA